MRYLYSLFGFIGLLLPVWAEKGNAPAAADDAFSRFDWTNPFPERVVTSIDIVRNDRPQLSIWAITAKKE